MVNEGKENMDDELEKYIANQKEIIVSSYEQAKSYSNIIMFGGYAGLFAIWSFTKDDLEKWQSLTVGLLTAISILIFVLFELISTWLRGKQANSLMVQLKEAEELHKFPEEYGKSEQAMAAKHMKIWPYFFFGSVITGVGAAVILVYSFISGLLCA